ncbi:MAG: di-trans,poly-cis-decaprenylcistransferase [Chloroflexi bacterium]|nr:di-trans,poly-cis-decaprenylcistransferase [Chloroflexota bacterium]
MQTQTASSAEIAPLPRHVAIIMDGNGRWAKRRGLPRLAGHRAGTENIHAIVECFLDFGIEYLTIYAFSTENWLRPAEEVMGLFGILEEVIHHEAYALHRLGVQVRHVGRLEGIKPSLQETIRWATNLTKDNTRMVLSVAFNYGGRRELVDAVRRIVAAGVLPADIDENVVGSYLYTCDIPDPDLIIRTGGEMRLSNFLIWQAAYAEYYATPVFWPDFGPDEVRKALLEYSQRQRRFGAVPGE